VAITIEELVAEGTPLALKNHISGDVIQIRVADGKMDQAIQRLKALSLTCACNRSRSPRLPLMTSF